MKNLKIFSKLGFAGLISIFMTGCFFSASVKSAPESFDVPFTGISISENSAIYAEVGVDVSTLKGQDLTRAVYSMLVKNPSQGTFTYSFDLYISKVGEADAGEVKLYTSRQARWDNPSLTAVLLSGEVFNPKESKDVIKSSTENPVLVEALRQGTIWVIVKNEIKDINLDFVLSGNGTPTGDLSQNFIQVNFPEPNSNIYDAKIKVSGTGVSTTVSNVNVYLDGNFQRSALVDSSTGNWNCTIDLSGVESGNHTIELEAMLTTGGPAPKLEIPITYLPSISVNDFRVEISARAKAEGLGFFPWIF